jgi:hypothetical protein
VNDAAVACLKSSAATWPGITGATFEADRQGRINRILDGAEAYAVLGQVAG